MKNASAWTNLFNEIYTQAEKDITVDVELLLYTKFMLMQFSGLIN